MPLALDTYFRGNSEEVAFCKAVGAGGNHLVAATAGGKRLGGKGMLRLRERELGPVLVEFRALAHGKRGDLALGGDNVEAAKRPVPVAPEGGLVIRGYCCYLKKKDGGGFEKARRYYYERNPDRWVAETQSDLLWLTAEERMALVPPKAEVGEVVEAGAAVRQRFFGTVGIDYMEGSVNALPVRTSQLRLTVTGVKRGVVRMKLEGEGEMGVAFDGHDRGAARSRGCRLRVEGWVEFELESGEFLRFDVAGVGEAWGNKMEYTRREIGIDDYPWFYGVAFELVKGGLPADRLPPYNLLHYGGGIKYFGE